MAYGIKDNAFSYILLTFANQFLGVPGYLASAALAIAIIWDGLTDPLLGHWSDKTTHRLGRRHPFMYASLLILPASFYALFNPLTEARGEDAFLYVLILSLLIRTGTTLFEVPSTALLPDLEKNYDQRNRWLALRHFFGWTGGNGLHTINMHFWVGGFGFAAATGYIIYGTVGAIIIALAIIASALGTQRVAARMAPPNENFKISQIGREFRQIFESLKNRNFAALFFYSLFVAAALGLGTALYLYNVRFFFEFTGTEIAITGLAILVAPLAAYLLAPRFGLRFGKKATAISMQLVRVVLYPIPYICVLQGFWPALGSAASIAIYTVFIFIEVTVGIMSAVMLDSMMADIVEDSEKQTNRRSEGLFFAARSFAGKFVSASGIIGAGVIVSLVGFDTITNVADFTDAHRLHFAILFLPAYCSLCLAGIACISLYRIDRQAHEENLRILEERHEGRPDSSTDLGTANN
tara:strand:+ start:4780 stop:6177 length:1398 start_codon:yes stop_codon:yes gene_type:complete